MPTTALTDRLDASAREFVLAPHRLLIGAAAVEAADGRTLASLDPSSGAEIATVPLAGRHDVDRAVAAARDALETGPWQRMPAAERARLIAALADAVEDHSDELAEIESLDNGKPVKLAKVVDVADTVAYLRYFSGWPTKIEGGVLPVAAERMLCYTRMEPVGVCGQIVPWNFPLLMAAWKVAPALAAGCTVVLKPAEQTPLSALRLGELALEVGFPPGVLNVLTGDGSTGAELVEHPGVDKIGFTGSTAVGRQVGAKASGALKRVTLELGGKSANIILPDADVEAAVKGAYQAIYFNSGQACNAGSRLYVPAQIFDEVLAALVDRASQARLGPGLDPATQLGPLISAEQQERVMRCVRQGEAEGAHLLAGGGPALTESGGWFFSPTLFAVEDDELAVSREEIFGPVLVASAYEELEEVVRRANSTPYGLAAGVWTRDLSAAHRLAQMLKAGTVYVNRWGASDPAAPFGGVKSSGVGREHGWLGLQAHLEAKTVWVAL